MTTAYLSLGSNKGDRIEYLKRALEILSKKAGTVTKVSPIYQTAAWGKTDQPDFYNIAVEISTSLPAEQLLNAILGTEQELGRHRTEKWGQRTIDIDILFFGNDIIDSTNLVIPHPHLQDRRFVLQPLNDINPKLIHPKIKKDISTLLAECTDPLPVTKLKDLQL
ncbi:MAG: 2-amino-4-hydroxy-6-hydroxymethyldihydropteridine diphosphokinase [Bacteroidetes bacterium 43-93]|nr:2-amino-4-hydroxy-6-hydroxymethyldihydropteridine diphosphokinase [Bacteroidota bacterium]OJW95559.1 MAG: 2-amino-4-hydroxy-6-hydroxymethyldihydropteridine diphosphokinase [Bacteroidetes bacterium 43-93]